jgi:hypothetical protein
MVDLRWTDGKHGITQPSARQRHAQQLSCAMDTWTPDIPRILNVVHGCGTRNCLKLMGFERHEANASVVFIIRSASKHTHELVSFGE